MFKYVNIRGMIYSIWIILGMCKRYCRDMLSKEK